MEGAGLVIDTVIFIEHLRGKDKTKTSLYKISGSPNLKISSITLYELLMGATDERKWNDVKLLTEDLTVIPLTDEVSVAAAKIYHRLRKSNSMIEFRDIFIAATCVVHNLPLMTSNRKHFGRIEDLKVVQ